MITFTELSREKLESKLTGTLFDKIKDLKIYSKDGLDVNELDFFYLKDKAVLYASKSILFVNLTV